MFPHMNGIFDHSWEKRYKTERNRTGISLEDWFKKKGLILINDGNGISIENMKIEENYNYIIKPTKKINKKNK